MGKKVVIVEEVISVVYGWVMSNCNVSIWGLYSMYT